MEFQQLVDKLYQHMVDTNRKYVGKPMINNIWWQVLKDAPANKNKSIQEIMLKKAKDEKIS
jgi:hypothetical protein